MGSGAKALRLWIRQRLLAVSDVLDISFNCYVYFPDYTLAPQLLAVGCHLSFPGDLRMDLLSHSDLCWVASGSGFGYRCVLLCVTGASVFAGPAQLRVIVAG